MVWSTGDEGLIQFSYPPNCAVNMLPKILLTLKKYILHAAGDRGEGGDGETNRQEDKGKFQKVKAYTKNYFLLIF